MIWQGMRTIRFRLTADHAQRRKSAHFFAVDGYETPGWAESSLKQVLERVNAFRD